MIRLLIIAILLGALVPPIAPAAADGSRAVLPDLYIPPYGVSLSTGQNDIYSGYIVSFYVVVGNQGPGVSTSANVTFYDNGTLFATVPIMENLSVSEPFNGTYVYYLWNTSALLPGNHTILISAMDTVGDANVSDNNCTRYLNVLSGPPPPTGIHLTLTPSSREATVSPTAQGTVSFNGSLSLDMPPGGYALVSIQSMVDAGWTAQVSPSSIAFSDNYTHSFQVTIIVPHASPSNLVAHLTVQARTTNLDDDLGTDSQANITVKPYYNTLLEVSMPYKEVEPGEPTSFDVKCWNTGNSIDQFNITIANRAELEENGWTLSLNRTVLERVHPNEYARFRLMATPPRDFSISKSEPAMIEVRAVSVGAERAGLVVARSFPLYVYQQGINKPVVGGISAAIGLLVVAVIIVALRVRRKRRAPPTAPK
jgi:hypothetical protein